ncbi:hypothetical protein SIN8267_02100 [Sinobacterium norvegicum]|uniref:DUF2188 domain-containing protein n=1 Tax=Sinobacterium norvegicum TaxID=1641715 RepID=A0ABM9AFK3_9GAMM|nr:hypothetical protein [Sinobacterium norvegicum]CAH0991985.1 hypothetical protein SIN8267_02100 [Sinobacterium norvegicum]
MSTIHAETITEGSQQVTLNVEQNDQGWTLEIVSDKGNITNYEDSFDSKEAALEEGRAAIAEGGVSSFFW